MRVERPWGWYEDLLEASGYKVKRLLVRSGSQLSLQRHVLVSESWTVVAGDGQLLCGETWYDATPGQMLQIPLGEVHRARGGQTDLVILEVQHGALISEDDIERLQDDFGRVLQYESNL